MKKILYLAYSYPPDSRSGTFRSLHFANELAINGKYKPIVLTVDPSCYENDVSFDDELLSKVDGGVGIVRTRCFQLRELVIGIKKATTRQGSKRVEKKVENTSKILNKGRFSKFKDVFTDEFLSFPDRQAGWLPFVVVSGIRTIKKENIDIVFATGSPWTAFLAGFLLKKICNKPLVIDYRDPWNDNPFYENSKTSRFKKISRALENIIVKNSDAIVTNTNKFENTLKKRFPDISKIFTVYNGYSNNDIENIGRNSTLDKRNEFILTHAGALYGHRTIENFLYAIMTLVKIDTKYETIRFQLIGIDEKTKTSAIKILGEEFATKYCYFSERVSHKECLSRLSESDCLIIFQQGTINQVPRKIFEYMALEKPIIAITDDCGETAQIIKRHSVGIAVSDSANNICSAIKDVFDDYEEYKLSLSCGSVSQNYEVKNLAKQIEKIFDGLNI